jgi:hypothetical protein
MDMTLKSGTRRLMGLLVCAAAIGCHKSDPVPGSGAAADPKAQIYKHLSKQTGQKQFTPGIDLDLPKQLATLRSNANVLEQRTLGLRASSRTADEQKRAALESELQELERAWEVARVAAARKQEELSHQEDGYIRSVRQQMSGVRTYQELYSLIGQQLATADRLLAEPDKARRRMGLKLAREACGHVNSDSVDVWLAARICEAYFWPNLEVADATPDTRERALDLLETARRVFFDTYETNNVLTNYNLLMANAPNARAADTFRVQLADWLEEKGSLQHAAEILNEIRDAEVLASAQDRITRVRERAAAAP